jgi:phosphoserine aminotransferase
MSVMEMSHRGKAFVGIAERAEADLRELLAVPSNYKVLFLQGGATAQFAAIPYNLTKPDSVADYVNTGAWSKKAIAEAKRYCKVNVAADAGGNYSTVPARDSWKLTPGAAYVHYTPNETIGGVEFPFIPDVGDVPLVADLSSTILSRPLDVSRFGVIYAGAQKNIGPAGLTIVIVRNDLIGQPHPLLPSAFDYQQQAENDSMLNTPPTYAIYIAGLVFEWLKSRGGLAAMAEHNRRKAALLYDLLDASSFYRSPVQRDSRSLMNVPFKLADDALDGAFLKGAEARGLMQLKGHRSVGGMRASIYNAMPVEGVQALVAYMHDFEQQHG